MRLFVGIELGERLAASVEADVARLRSGMLVACPALAARWVSRANLHLTLVFLGEVPDAGAPAVRAALHPPFGVRRFTLGLREFGTFPPSGPLRVIWMGIADGVRDLTSLHEEVRGRLPHSVRSGDAPVYAPHLTVARVKDARGALARAARVAVRTAGPVGGTTRVDAVTLFQSRLSSAGSAYEALMRVPLPE